MVLLEETKKKFSFINSEIVEDAVKFAEKTNQTKYILQILADRAFEVNFDTEGIRISDFLDEVQLEEYLQNYKLPAEFIYDVNNYKIAKKKKPSLTFTSFLSSEDKNKIAESCDQECDDEHVNRRPQHLSFRNKSNGNFKSVFCKHTQERINCFKNAFKVTNNFNGLLEYLSVIEPTKSNEGLQWCQKDLFIKVVQRIFKDECLFVTEEPTLLLPQREWTKPFPDVSKYKQCERVFIPLGLNIDNGEEGHQNYVFIDKKNKSVYVFEPNGSCGAPWYYDVLYAIEEQLKGYDHVKIDCLCNAKGPQFIFEQNSDDETSGFCVSWSLLFLILQIANPNIPAEFFQAYANMNLNSSSTQYISVSDNWLDLAKRFTSLCEQMIPDVCDLLHENDLDKYFERELKCITNTNEYFLSITKFFHKVYDKYKDILTDTFNWAEKSNQQKLLTFMLADRVFSEQYGTPVMLSRLMPEPVDLVKYLRTLEVPAWVADHIDAYKFITTNYPTFTFQQFLELSDRHKGKTLFENIPQVLRGTSRACQQECADDNVDNSPAKISFRNVSNARFKSVLCEHSQSRIELFKNAFKVRNYSLDPLIQYLKDIEPTHSVIGLQKYRKDLFIKVIQKVFEEQCMFSSVDGQEPVLRVDTFSKTCTWLRTFPAINQECKRVFIPLGIGIDNDNNHFAYVYVNNVQKNVYLFEPNGSCVPWYWIVADAVARKLGYSRVEINCLCGINGPQNKSVENIENIQGGFCVSWSLLFLIVQIANPDVPDFFYRDYTLTNDSGTLHDLVKKFTSLCEHMIPHVNEHTDKQDADAYFEQEIQCIK
jgi:hypothetical protein